MPTCCAMLAATRWQTRELIPARSKRTWATEAFNQPCATPSWRRGVSRTCGGARAMYLFQSAIIFAVMGTNIAWEWAPDGYVAGTLAACVGLTVSAGLDWAIQR